MNKKDNKITDILPVSIPNSFADRLLIFLE